MHFASLKIASLAFLAVGASAATHRVEVGKGGLTYSPNTIKADEGDIIEFHFNSMHTVVAGDFNSPCNPASSGGFYSGVMPMDGKQFFSVAVNSTDPMFFYCAIQGHCQAGMVGVINQGSDTLSAFKSAAGKTEKSTSPAAAFGGTLGDSAESTQGPQSIATKTGAAVSASSSSSSVSSAARDLCHQISRGTWLAQIVAVVLAL